MAALTLSPVQQRFVSAAVNKPDIFMRHRSTTLQTSPMSVMSRATMVDRVSIVSGQWGLLLAVAYLTSVGKKMI